MTDWKPEKNISSPWDANVWENNIGQPVKPSGDNLPYPYTTPSLKIGPSGYKLDPNKLKEAPRQILPYFDEKIDNLIEKTKRNFYASKLTAERNYEYKFDRINDNFEYAKEHGEFRPKLKLSYTATGLSAGSYETSFVIKQGNKHEGYYTFGNGRYFKYYMPTKPNVIARFFMKTCLALRWVDEKNG
jgi:hypothetical protein